MNKLYFSWKHLMIWMNLLIVGLETQVAPPTQTPAPAPAPAPNQNLPQTETSSVNDLLYQLKPIVALSSIDRGYCQNSQSGSGYTISCNYGCYHGEKCHIDKVIISKMDLSGIIDPGISDLSRVTSIDLSHNKLHGSIPDTLGNLRYLEFLDLSDNRLSGTIPDSLGYLWSLEKLLLHRNFLEGGIPSTLGNLRNLTDLKLNYNKLSGSLPVSLGDLENLKYLRLAENRLSGTIPPELGNLIYLISFYVSSNIFSGNLPDLKMLTNLESFEVAGNMLTGRLPTYIAEWTDLRVLALQGNNFSGPVPEQYFQMSSLETMIITDLADSSGVNFPEKPNLPNIYKLVLRRCSISGPIPRFIGDLTTLRHLDLSYNRLTGHIPESMRPNLIYMSLARNNLSGTIPNWIFEASKTRMDLSYNNFSTMDVPIPSNLDLNLFACCCCEVSSTTEPYMLQPADMAKEYSKNKPQIYNLFINCGGGQTHSENTLYNADNDTSPFYISPAENWAYTFSGDFLALTTNSSDYTQSVPCRISDSESSLYDDARLAPVSLDYYGFGLREGPYNVTLHFVEIVYEDERNYDILRKRVFDIYVQDKLVMKDFDITYHAGGPNKVTTVNVPINVTDHMLSIHLYWAGKGSYVDLPSLNGPLIAAVSVNPKFHIDNGKFSAWKIALIALASLVVALLLLLALAWSMGWLENKELKKRVKVGTPYKSGANEEQDVTVTLKELIAATGNFSQDVNKKIGFGYWGEVFKAEATGNLKITVAVKKFYPRHKGKLFNLFRNEIQYLKALESENLVKLFDAHNGETLQLFIYEYMENKSLETALFNSKAGTFPWQTRLEICKGIAMGLNSLHQNSPYKIVHGNLKASNILLSKENKPKLSDFGCAGIHDEDDKVEVLKERAKRGILAPEYRDGITMKDDILNFGVILLEIVAGRGNRQTVGNKEAENLVDKVHLHFKEQNPSLPDFIDKKLEGQVNEKEVKMVLKLAKMCTNYESSRPSMSDILSVLDENKKVDEISLVESPSTSNNTGNTSKASASSK